MYWEEVEQNFGTVKEAITLKFTFKAKDNIPKVISVVGLCWCTRVRYYVEKRRLEVEYKSAFVPNHLNEQEVRKTILVTYEDGTEDFLYIVGTKIR